MSKRIYIVKGSEDGILGVYGSVTKALKVATEYLKNSCEGEGEMYSEKCDLIDGQPIMVRVDIETACTQLRQGRKLRMDLYLEDGSIAAEIETWNVE